MNHCVRIHGLELAFVWSIILAALLVWVIANKRKPIETAWILASFGTTLWLMIWTLRWAVQEWVARGGEGIPVP